MKKKFIVEGMTCAACQSHVQKAIDSLKGVTYCNVNLLTNSAEVDFVDTECSIQDISNAVSNAGYKLINKEKKIEKKDYKPLIELIICGFLLLVLMYISMGHMINLPLPSFMMGYDNALVFALSQLVLTIPVCIIYRKYFINGYKRLFTMSPNMDSLIAISATASIVYGLVSIGFIGYGLNINDLDLVKSYYHNLYFESASMILTLVSLGKYFENLSKKKTTKAITQLMDLAPKMANVEKDGEIKNTPVEEVNIDDVVVVKIGEAIPIDGQIIEGSGSLDQSTITGESVPVYKTKGEDVFSSTILTSGFIKVKATKVGEDTSIANIIRLVEEASNSKAPISKLVDKIAGIFVPIILLISVVTFIVNLIVSGDFELAFNFCVSVLVIACPCALGLATPVAIMVGTGKGAELGLLIRNAEILEKAHNIKTVVLDKTGTITEGSPVVDKIIKYADEDFITEVISIEKHSSHPLVNALLKYQQDNNIDTLNIDDYEFIEGKGVKGTINNSIYYVGNIKLLKDLGIANDKVEEDVKNYSKSGCTVLVCIKDSDILGIILVKDKIKETSKEAISLMKDMGMKVIMLTGDNKQTASSIAKEVGIDDIYAEVLPQEKQTIVKSLKTNDNNLVAMIGDGVNDALALVDADLGITLGGGSDIAKDSSDIVLLRNDLLDVCNVINLSKKVLSTIKGNLFWAFFYNCIGVILASGLLYYSFGIKLNPMIGSAAMSLSSIFVVTNALRINLFKLKKHNLKQKEENVMDTIVIKVEGMMCPRCKAHVEKAVLAFENVITANASVENKYVVVTLKEKIDPILLVNAIKEEGYEASL